MPQNTCCRALLLLLLCAHALHAAPPESGKVAKILNGATLVVEAGGKQHRVVLIGVDPKAKAAGLIRLAPVGTPVALEYDPAHTASRHYNSKGCLLAYVHKADATGKVLMLNTQMLAKGYARATTTPPYNPRRMKQFLEIQSRVLVLKKRIRELKRMGLSVDSELGDGQGPSADVPNSRKSYEAALAYRDKEPNDPEGFCLQLRAALDLYPEAPWAKAARAELRQFTEDLERRRRVELKRRKATAQRQAELHDYASAIATLRAPVAKPLGSAFQRELEACAEPYAALHQRQTRFWQCVCPHIKSRAYPQALEAARNFPPGEHARQVGIWVATVEKIATGAGELPQCALRGAAKPGDKKVRVKGMLWNIVRAEGECVILRAGGAEKEMSVHDLSAHDLDVLAEATASSGKARCALACLYALDADWASASKKAAKAPACDRGSLSAMALALQSEHANAIIAKADAAAERGRSDEAIATLKDLKRSLHGTEFLRHNGATIDDRLDELAKGKAGAQVRTVPRKRQTRRPSVRRCPRCNGRGYSIKQRWRLPHPGAVNKESYRVRVRCPMCRGTGKIYSSSRRSSIK